MPATFTKLMSTASQLPGVYVTSDCLRTHLSLLVMYSPVGRGSSLPHARQASPMVGVYTRGSSPSRSCCSSALNAAWLVSLSVTSSLHQCRVQNRQQWVCCEFGAEVVWGIPTQSAVERALQHQTPPRADKRSSAGKATATVVHGAAASHDK
jgi:hypothetical protein